MILLRFSSDVSPVGLESTKRPWALGRFAGLLGIASHGFEFTELGELDGFTAMWLLRYAASSIR
jgi:hypothetical protein